VGIKKILSSKIGIPMNSDATEISRLSGAHEKTRTADAVLSFVWLCILTHRTRYGNEYRRYRIFGTAIWILFIFYFPCVWWTLPKRISFLKKNCLFISAILISMLVIFSNSYSPFRWCVH